jgi:hypothetical protein
MGPEEGKPANFLRLSHRGRVDQDALVVEHTVGLELNNALRTETNQYGIWPIWDYRCRRVLQTGFDRNPYRIGGVRR